MSLRPSHQQRCLPFKKDSTTPWYSSETLLIRILEDNPLLNASQKAKNAPAAVMHSTRVNAQREQRRWRSWWWWWWGGGVLIGGKLVKRKVRPPPVLPLRSALPLTEIASKAGPTKNNLDSAATLSALLFQRKHSLPLDERRSQSALSSPIISICRCSLCYNKCVGASF